jgi:hypothetical protein
MTPGKPGRPPVNRPTGRKVTLYLLPDVEAKAREIGHGNMSGGVSAAVHAYALTAKTRKRRD